MTVSLCTLQASCHETHTLQSLTNINQMLSLNTPARAWGLTLAGSLETPQASLQT